MFLALSPITATALGTALLGETPSLGVGAGLALVSAGIWLATRSPAARTPAPAAG